MDGRRRHYRVRVPAELDPERPAPLVVALHSAFSTGRQLAAWSGFDARADRDGVVVVYPEGFGILGLLQHWNAGHCCGRAARKGIDDLGYLDAVVRDARARYAVDPDRLYLAGYSNGGMMAHLFAAARADSVAALAVVAGPVGSATGGEDPVIAPPEPGRPVPALVLHGTADVNIPYEGGPAPANPGRRYLPAIESARFWACANGVMGPDPPLHADARGIGTRAWGAGTPGREVVLRTLPDWDHAWPGGRFTARLDAGHPLHGYEAADEIWAFFRRHGLAVREAPAGPKPAAAR